MRKAPSQPTHQLASQPTRQLVSKTSKNTAPFLRLVVKVQAVVRGHLCRKRYKRLVRQKYNRSRIVQEILSTEQSFLKSLTTLTDVYLAPLKEDYKRYSLTKEEYHTMFPVTEPIVQLHKELLRTLEERITSWNDAQMLGDVFIQIGPFLKMLTGYCSNYDTAVTMLAQFRSERKAFAAFMDKCETSANQPLISCLIQPIQRVPRYNLLLEELVRNTWEWHRDYDQLCNALKAMRQIAEHINQSLHGSDNANKVVKIQSELGGECMLLAPHRRWVKDGPLRRVKRQGTKASPVSTNKLWVYLFNDIIVFAGRILTSYRFMEQYPLISTTIVDLQSTTGDENRLCFQIACFDSEFHSYYILAAETAEERDEWFAILNKTAEQRAASAPNIKLEQRKTIEREMTGFMKTMSPKNARNVATVPQAPVVNDNTTRPRSKSKTNLGIERVLITEEDSDSDGEGGVLSFQERRKLFEKGILDSHEKTEAPLRPRKQVGKLSPQYASLKLGVQPPPVRQQTDLVGEAKPLPANKLANFQPTSSVSLEKRKMPASPSLPVIPENGTFPKSNTLKRQAEIPPQPIDRRTLPPPSIEPEPLPNQHTRNTGAVAGAIAVLDRKTLPLPTSSELYQKKKNQTMSPSKRAFLLEQPDPESNTLANKTNTNGITNMPPVLVFLIADENKKEATPTDPSFEGGTEREMLLGGTEGKAIKKVKNNQQLTNATTHENVKEKGGCGCVIS